MLPERSPHFLIQEEGQSLQTYQKVIIPNDTIEAMILYGQFKLKVVEVKLINRLALTEIKLCLKGDCFPISGFPRVLKHDESLMLSMSKKLVPSKINKLTKVAQICDELPLEVKIAGPDVRIAKESNKVTGSRLGWFILPRSGASIHSQNQRMFWASHLLEISSE